MLRLSALLLVIGIFLACNAPERAAKMIRKNAQEKARLLVLPAQACVEAQLKTIEGIITPPSLSESLAEKTELISSW